MRFNKFAVDGDSGISVSFDGLAIGVYRTDESALSPEEAWDILHRVLRADTARAVTEVVNLPADAAPLPKAAPKGKARKQTAEETPTTLSQFTAVHDHTEYVAEKLAEVAPLVAHAAHDGQDDPAPILSAPVPAEHSASEELAADQPAEDSVPLSADAAPVPGEGGIPDTVLQAFRIKDVVAYFLDKGFNPDNIWAAVEPYASTIPALKRLPNPQERVERVAAAYF